MLEGKGGNIGVSIGDDGVLLVDNQFAPLGDKITAAVKTLTNTPIDFVTNTLWYCNHSDGNPYFGKAGATTVSHENSREGLPTFTFYRNLPMLPSSWKASKTASRSPTCSLR